MMSDGDALVRPCYALRRCQLESTHAVYLTQDSLAINDVSTLDF